MVGTIVTAAVGFAQTEARVGNLLETGAAFAYLDAQEPRATARLEERIDVVVIGAGQAGLSVGYHLARHGVPHAILEANTHVGDNWRRRWDSLRLFSPARFNGLDGMGFPAPARSFPTKDEMGDFLAAYAARFQLPVRTGVKVKSVTRRADGRFVLDTGAVRFVADQVVIAAASYQAPKMPDFAPQLDASIRQLHARDYKNPAQLKPGSVLLVGAGNSGAEIALDLVGTHRVWLAGAHPGHLPIPHDGALAFHVVVPILFRLVFHRLLSVDTPLGRKARPHFLHHSGPVIRARPSALAGAGVQRVPRVTGVRDGQPLLADGRRLEIDNIVWCTGYRPGLEWVHLPVFDGSGRPRQYRGVATDVPGLYFAGLSFQHSPSSTMIHGAGRDARRVVERIVERVRATRP